MQVISLTRKKVKQIILFWTCAFVLYTTIDQYGFQTHTIHRPRTRLRSHVRYHLLSGKTRSARTSLLRTRSRSFEFPDMPDPCATDRISYSNVEDVLCMKRPTFLSNFKNPCWRSDTGYLRCLPYFHIIGSAKGATTDLYNRLNLHPQLCSNWGHLTKETWYWSWKRYGKEIGSYVLNSTRMIFDEFIDSFKAFEIEEKQTHGYHNLITGHGDPMDFTDFHFNFLIPQNDPGAQDLIWTTPYLIKHLNPGVKLILILRDPIERLYSYYFFTGVGESSLDFHNDVIVSLQIWRECVKSKSFRRCLYDVNIKRQLKVALHTSFYSSHLKEWLKVFPREQILILRTEDYRDDIQGTLRRVFRYLGISKLPPRSLKAIADLPRDHVTDRKHNAGPMINETRQLLVKFYKKSVNRLVKLLNDERFAFKDVSFSVT